MHSLPGEPKHAFYAADDVVAATLNITPMTVKNARKALKKNRYIKTKPGGIYAAEEGRKYKATIYYLDPYRDFLKELKNKKGNYTTYPKYSFEALLRSEVSHKAILLHFYLRRLEALNNKGDYGIIEISTRHNVFKLLSSQSGMHYQTIKRAFKELTNLKFISGNSWVSLKTQGLSYTIRLEYPADPGKNENNKQNRNNWLDSVYKKVRQQREKRKQMANRDVRAHQILAYFKGKFLDVYGKPTSVNYWFLREDVTKQIQNYGNKRLKRAIDIYLETEPENQDLWENPTKAKTRTFKRFLCPGNFNSIMEIVTKEIPLKKV